MANGDRKNNEDHNRDAQVIDAAYGLVQGALGTFGDLNSDKGYREFQKPDVQDAAIKAARAFLAEINFTR